MEGCAGWRWITRRFLLAVAIFSLASIADSATANATKQAPRRHKVSHAKKAAAAAPARTYTDGRLYKGALIEDADTGRVLLAYNADMEWPPASMAKMMLLLVAQEQISQGRFSPNDMVRISERSAHTGGSRVGLKEGDIYPLRELIKAALVKSANDAAVAVAEKIGGSVEAMVRMMNQRARELGMTHTEYQTVDGLPPRPTHDADRTTAYDLATVGRAIIRETNLLEWSSQESVDFDGGVCMLHNTNHLVGHFDGCDGLKTGFTYQAGFNVTTTAKRGNMRIIAVVLGAPSNAQRFAQAAKLMEWAFDHYTAVSLLKSGEALPVQVQIRSGPAIRPVAASDLNVVMRKTDVSSVKLVYDIPPMVEGPLRPGDPLGRVTVHSQGEVLTEASAICPIAFTTPSDQVVTEGYNAVAAPAP
ncbi:MAG: D-alanyl-D-alanine carboxypeptidase family protein [Candidatus Binatus sp.]|uniref:D-alanyl-D-alanine carboxypeptidase family protein n=1 Tax=Candidatus Binatus sp. TaxID=2811406 RepID=UPI002721FDD8|nr:D-alanyl-D-alanine carboxypeptidase family protein [Candidatus Binatus sp.]MDO8433244.1 D-alanyl-D-alanine carboxypeptidase family protein [Candidatus Binatus sp.]